MFKDDYKNDLNNINPEENVKDEILRKIKNRKDKFNFKKIVFRTVAVVTVCALAICGTVVLLNHSQPDISISNPEITQTYGDVYKVIKDIKAENSINFLNGFLKGGVDLYSIEDSDDGISKSVLQEGVTTSNTNGDVKDHSETNNQVEGVAESDIVLTGGEYIYSLTEGRGSLRIIKAGKEPELLSNTTIKPDLNYENFYVLSSMYLFEDYIVILGNYYSDDNVIITLVYDVSNPCEPKEVYQFQQSGFYNTSRLIGDKLYLISDYNINLNNVEKNKPETFVPYTKCNDEVKIVSADSICINSVYNSPVYTVICGYDIAKGELVSSQSMFGGIYALYCSTNNILTAGYPKDGKTPISRYSIEDGKVKYKTSSEIEGFLLNQFSMDEYKNYFRFVTTSSGGKETRNGNSVSFEMTEKNALYVLDENLKPCGAITDIAPGERVYSVRFMGDVAYFVTFRQVDPLFSVDLSDPKNPKIIGALKIPGFSNYLFPFGEGKLLGLGQEADEETGRTEGMKISMFDISDPSNVTESDKFVLADEYSNALFDHKASLVDYKKNLIGFNTSSEKGNQYHIFRFTDKGFSEVKSIYLSSFDGYVRGMYIGEEFYIVTQKKIYVFNMTDFEKIAELNLF